MVSEEQDSDMELAGEVVPVPRFQPTTVEAPEVDGDNDAPHKKIRRRKKALYAAVLQQMEFYFSDSNLAKDRFISELVRQNPDVDLEVFLKFNKIRALTTDVSQIAKALQKSTILKVSGDGKKVRRITPVVEKMNVDECTVYVQRLPPDADHDWLSKLFSKYGKIAYVSIPKFKLTHKIKGFAFVEFDTPEGAEKCLKEYRAKGCELPSQTIPSNILSITTFQEEEKQAQEINNQEAENNGTEKKKKKKHNNLENSEIVQTDSIKLKRKKENDHDSDSCTDEGDNKKKKKKIIQNDLENSEAGQIESTKLKIKKENSENSDVCADSNTEGEEIRSRKRKNRHSLKDALDSDVESKKVKIEKAEEVAESDKNETDNAEENKETLEENTSEKKKKRKKNRNRYDTNVGIETVQENSLVGIQVMAKREWKKLRNKYLDLQRVRMKELKQHLRKARWNQWGDKIKIENEDQETVIEKKENSASNLEFSPGVIVKIEFNEPCIDTKGFKAEIKNNNNNIKYVDIKDGSSIAFVRCDSAEAAAALSQKTNEEKRFEVLTGEEETSYWDKIRRDREEKIGSNTRQKQRGRKKLLKNAEKELGKHIKFDD